jgi:hypothetical protein
VETVVVAVTEVAETVEADTVAAVTAVAVTAVVDTAAVDTAAADTLRMEWNRVTLRNRPLHQFKVRDTVGSADWLAGFAAGNPQ